MAGSMRDSAKGDGFFLVVDLRGGPPAALGSQRKEGANDEPGYLDDAEDDGRKS